MAIEIIVPRLGWSMEEGAFVKWLKKEGEFVQAGDPLFSIEGDKAIQEIESIDSGLLRIAPNCPKPGGVVRVGDVLGHLLATASAAATPLEPAAVPPPEVPRTKTAPPAAPERSQPPAPPAPARSSRGPAISPRALRAAAELGIDWKGVAGTGRGGRIRERDIRASSPSPRPAVQLPGSRTSVLVTGGCGFIGTWVIRELLNRGLHVVVLDMDSAPARWERIIGPARQKISLVRGSLLDADLLARTFQDHGVTNVIHLAALLTPACQADPWEGCRINVLGSIALFERLRKAARRIEGFAYASSVAVFGEEPDHASLSAERSASDPVTFYGIFKKSLELIAGQYWRQFKIPSVGIRPQVAYGPERETGLTAGPSLAARAAARGEPFSIGYTGRVGYDYVEDVARAFVRAALETPPGAHVVDLSGAVADVNDVIAAIAAVRPEAARKLSAAGPPIPAYVLPNPHFISALYPDWQTTPLAEGMKRTVEFYQPRH